jgi:aryl-alcohol dehydrogenase-like predicted oxidoreductase
VITYFSLASGFLTGKYRTQKDLAGRARADMVRKYMNERGLCILEALERVARQLDQAPAAVALAWLINRPGISAPIASATSPEQLATLIQATNIELDASAVDLLNQASAYP